MSTIVGQDFSIHTSYFYKVRFMQPYQIPLSTAVFDPKWFHNFQGHSHLFLDKNGVINGLRADFFAPDESCNTLCRGKQGCLYTPDVCMFLQKYREQLDKLDYDYVMDMLYRLSLMVIDFLKLERAPEFMLLFHEAPDNTCSERVPVQEWFAHKGFSVSEWTS